MNKLASTPPEDVRKPYVSGGPEVNSLKFA